MSLVNELRAEIQSLRADLTALAEYVVKHDKRLDNAEAACRRHERFIESAYDWDYISEGAVMAHGTTPPQPTAAEGDCPTCHGAGGSEWTEEEGSVTCPDCAGSGKGADSITEDAKWEAVLDAWNEGFNAHPYPIDAHGVRTERYALKAAVAKAIELGLAARPISADDEGLVQVVADTFPDSFDAMFVMDHAKRILTAIAAAQQEVQ